MSLNQGQDLWKAFFTAFPKLQGHSTSIFFSINVSTNYSLNSDKKCIFSLSYSYVFQMYFEKQPIFMLQQYHITYICYLERFIVFASLGNRPHSKSDRPFYLVIKYIESVLFKIYRKQLSNFIIRFLRKERQQKMNRHESSLLSPFYQDQVFCAPRFLLQCIYMIYQK